MTMIQSLPRKAVRPAQSPMASLGKVFVGLAAWMRRRRQLRASQALLDTFDERLLADIGLRRDQIDPGRQSDIIGIMFSRDARGTRYDRRSDG